MHRHDADPLSAVLGIAAVVVGLFVTVGAAADVDVDLTAWIAVAALLAGLAIIPWRRRPTPDEAGAGADETS